MLTSFNVLPCLGGAMIIGGYTSTQLQSEPIQHATCQSCREVNTLRVDVFASYVHVYWLPLVPIRKSGEVICTSCGAVRGAKDLPAEIRQQYDDVVWAASRPWYHFLGLALLTSYAGYLLLLRH